MMLVKFTGYHNNKPVEEWNESFDSAEEATGMLQMLGFWYHPKFDYWSFRDQESNRIIEKAVIVNVA